MTAGMVAARSARGTGRTAVGANRPFGYPRRMRTPAGGFSAVDSSPSRPPPEEGYGGEEASTLKSARASAAELRAAAAARPSSAADPVESEERAAASLDGLEVAIEQVSTGLRAALELKNQLSSELAEVRTSLAAALLERDSLSARVAVLEHQLEEALREAERNRDFLMSEQDTFIASVLDEHEKALAELTRERDAALERAAVASVQTARPPRVDTQPGLGAVTEPPPPSDEPSPAELDKVLADRERSRQLFTRLQSQRDEAQRELVARLRERDELMRELERLAPERFKPEKKAWSAADARRTIPAIPQIVGKVEPVLPSVEAFDPSEGDRVTAPPTEEAVSALDASRPSPPKGTAAVTEPSAELGADGKPLIKRKPDPTQRPLGAYSLSGEEVAEPEAPISSVRNR